MWKIKTFKTRKEYCKFINKNKNKILFKDIFLNNMPYAIEYKKLIIL